MGTADTESKIVILYVILLTDGKTFLNVQEEYRNVSYSTGQTVEWRVIFNGIPAPKVVWLDNRGKMIPWSEIGGEGRRVAATIGNQWTVLKIQNLTFKDTGFYKMFVDNRHQRREKIFDLLVEGNLINSLLFVI